MLKINFIKGNKDIALPNGTKTLIKEACRKVLEVEGFNHSAEINISIVNDEIIRTINKDFRNIDKATDVLSFPLGEDGCYDVNPENDCAWIKIYERLQATNQLEKLSVRRKDKGYGDFAYPRTISLRGKK